MLRKGRLNYKKEDIANFSHIEQVQIGKNYFSNEDLKEYFGAIGDIADSNKSAIVLLKQVFQTEYPITRLKSDKSLPRVPVKQEEKYKLIECITKYFNRLRSKIINKKYKTGDSISLREMLSELQSIKVLKEHFEETKETFPYHMFKDYLDNEDYINLKGNINSQLKDIQTNNIQDERIRNLLRQFTLTYLKNKDKNQFILKDPGTSQNEFSVNDNMPAILEDLIVFLNGKHLKYSNNESYNAYNLDITQFIDETRRKIDELRGKRDSIELPSGGGTQTIQNELEDIRSSYNELFDSMVGKYNDLLTLYNSKKTSKECEHELNERTEDLEDENGNVANSEERISILTAELEKKNRELEGLIAEKNENKAVNAKRIEKLKTSLNNVRAELRSNEKIYKKNKIVQSAALEAAKAAEDEAKATAALEAQEKNSSLISKDKIIFRLTREKKEAQRKAAVAEARLKNEKNSRNSSISSASEAQEARNNEDIADNNNELDILKANALENEATIASLRGLLENRPTDDLVAELRRELQTATNSLAEKDATATRIATEEAARLSEARQEKARAEAAAEAARRELESLRTSITQTVQEQLALVRAQAEADAATAAAAAAAERERIQSEAAAAAAAAAEKEREINQRHTAELAALRAQINTPNTTPEQIRASIQSAIDQFQQQHTEQLQRLQTIIDSQNQTLAQLRASTDQTIQSLNARIADLEGDNTRQAQTELDALRAELEAARARIGQISTSDSALQLENARIKSALQACNIEKNDCNEQLTAERAKTAQLTERIGVLEREVGAAQESLRDAIAARDAAQGSTATARAEAERSVAEARQQVAEAEARVRAAQGEAQTARDETAAAREETSTAREQKAAAEAAAAAARDRAATAEANEAAARAEVSRVTALQEEAQRARELAESTARIAQRAAEAAEGRATAAERDKATAEREKAAAEQREAQAQVDKATAERNREAAERDKAAAERDKAAAEAKAAQAQADKTAAEGRAGQAEGKAAAAETAKAAAEREKAAADARASAAQQRATDAEREKAAAEGREAQAQADKAAAEQREAQADARAAQAQADKTAAEGREAQADARAAQAQADKTAAEGRAEQAEEAAANSRIAMDAAILAQQAAVQAREAAEEALRAALDRATRAEDAARESSEQLQNALQQIQQKEATIREQASRISGLEDEVARLKAEGVRLRAELAEKDAEIARLRAQLANLQAQQQAGRLRRQLSDPDLPDPSQPPRVVPRRQEYIPTGISTPPPPVIPPVIPSVNNSVRTTFTEILGDIRSNLNAYFGDNNNRATGVLWEIIHSIRTGMNKTKFDNIKDTDNFSENYSSLGNILRSKGAIGFNKKMITKKDFLTKFDQFKYQDIIDMKNGLDPILRTILTYGDSSGTLKNSLQMSISNRSTIAYTGGGSKDMLLDYCNKVANNSLNTFLLEEPLPFFSLIEDFEKGSKMDILKTTNEEYILKLFIKHHLEEHFDSKEMKEFYFHAKELFAKQECSEYAKMFFVLNEIINVIRNSKEDIDVVRIKSKEYNSSFDYLEYILQDYEYDFYTVAKKKFLLDDTDVKRFDLTFIKENIYISVNKGSKTYDFNKDLTLTRRDFDFKSDIYYISSHMIYLFFILSTHFYLQSENMIDNDDYFTVSNNLEKTVRKLKRTKNKEKKSIAKLFKERKEFKLDG